SGKWVVAYGDSYSQGDYLVASTADECYLNPVGSIDIHGVGGSTPFFKGLLDKAGVKMQIIKVGTFKSAVEPYVLTSMSEPARLQMQQYCDSIWNYVAETISDNSGMPVDSVYILAPQMIATREASFFVETGLADELAYEREVENHLRDLTDLDLDDDLRLVSPADYLSANSSKFSFSTEKRHIAVYYATGDIVDAGSEGIVGKTVVDDIISLAEDKDVAGLVFRVNSPGGSAFASEQIWEALQYFKSKHKPLFVSMGDYAASGGYYISCGADSIFADRTTLTGSIGVFGMIPDLSGLVTDKLGVNFSTVQTNPNATGISLTQPMTPEQHAAMQKSVENIYELFTSRVAEGRGMSQDSVKAIAEGRVWTGGRAVQLGLVDRLGSLRSTVEAMAEHLGMNTSETVAYPIIDENVWEKILRESGGLEMEMPLDESTLEYLYFVKRLREMNPMQARMEEIVIE
ncbi:MAG: signal peptide peptidase SppA, partial [Muribaculaceae bacterium]|nr:signal peptide peptidase SppA [Muribaculaceae bacterium]